MKIIVCSGDSHTCGQGATGYSNADHAMFGYNTMGKGIMRSLTPDVPCYLNLIRRFVNEATASSSVLSGCSELSVATGLPIEYNCIRLPRERITLPVSGELAILQFAEKQAPARVSIYLDGVLCRTITLYANVTRFGEWSFRNISIPCQGAGSLSIEVTQGEVWLSSIEVFSGKWAVLGSGVGSCDSARYCREYFAEGVVEFSPSIVIAEMHTINDWVAGVTPEQYKKNINALIDSIEAIGATPIMLSVSPIVGDRAGYEELIAAGEQVVRERAVAFADAHAQFEKQLCGMDDEQRRAAMYADRWHVNDVGHRIYADTLKEVLRKYL